MSFQHRAPALRTALAAALAIVLSSPAAQAHDLPSEWAGFAAPPEPAQTRRVVTRQEWSLLSQSATGLGMRLPTPAEQAWLAAAREGRWSEVLKALKDGTVQPNVRDEAGYSVLTLAVRAGEDSVVREMLSQGADPEVRGADGLTALGLAAYLGQQTTVRRLLEAGADVDRAGHNGYTPVQMACISGRVDALDELLKAHPDLERPDRRGRHALGVAAFFGRISAMQRLVDAGFDPATLDSRGFNAQHAAVEGGQFEAIEWLRSRHAPAAAGQVAAAH